MARSSIRARRLLLLGLVIGCAPTSPAGSGCDTPRRATDASFAAVYLKSGSPPCVESAEAARGSDPRLQVRLYIDGESDPFLIAVRVGGELHSLHQVQGDPYNSTMTVDAGPWEPPDTTWREVEIVIDPLNLFQEVDESNNQGRGQVRLVDPDMSLDVAACGFAVPLDVGGDGFTLVDQVPAATPVNVWLRMKVGGPYEGALRSVRSGGTLEASSTVEIETCYQTFKASSFLTRWTPPGPGTYEVEFEVRALGETPDPPGNNQLTKVLEVTGTPATATPESAAPVAGNPR